MIKETYYRIKDGESHRKAHNRRTYEESTESWELKKDDNDFAQIIRNRKFGNTGILWMPKKSDWLIKWINEKDFCEEEKSCLLHQIEKADNWKNS